MGNDAIIKSPVMMATGSVCLERILLAERIAIFPVNLKITADRDVKNVVKSKKIIYPKLKN
jgi:hypothetical protein